MRLSLALVVLLGVAVLQGQGCPDCSDPSRPWLRGNIEKSCASPYALEGLRRTYPERTILECHCRHTCDPTGERANETDRRGWDYRCEARCNPSNCACDHPCEET